jgi:hypothetical protein
MNEKLREFSPEELIRAAIELTVFEMTKDQHIGLSNEEIETVVESVYNSWDTNHLYCSIRNSTIIDDLIKAFNTAKKLWPRYFNRRNIGDNC